MRHSIHGRTRQQFNFLRRQFLQDGQLPFSDVLSEEAIAPALESIDDVWKDRIYTPLVTLWIFLGQVLSADHSCRAAVARLIAHRVSQGLSACSSITGAYCQARSRLPEKFFSTVTRQVGRALDARAHTQWLWNGRRVYMFDGTTVSMPDTAANQKEYPQNVAQQPGLGFPIARIGAIISLSCGAVLDVGFCKYAGKGQGEVSLLRRMLNNFQAGDVLLADCLMANWLGIHMLEQRGIKLVSRLNKANRKADFRKGIRLGKYDHIVRWKKPSSIRSIDWKTYHSLPEFITVRETRILVEQPGFRTRSIVIVTTFLDPQEITKDDLAFLYRARWNNELDLRSIKISLQMDILRCKTPELVRKEVWTHILAYNLIRTIMAQAANEFDILPRTISFKATMQTLEAFQPMIAIMGRSNAALRQELYEQVLTAIGNHRVADRPDRFEPRMRKRRHKKSFFLTKPRAETKREMLKGFSEN